VVTNKTLAAVTPQPMMRDDVFIMFPLPFFLLVATSKATR
jgi:hypothetical protein